MEDQTTELNLQRVNNEWEVFLKESGCLKVILKILVLVLFLFIALILLQISRPYHNENQVIIGLQTVFVMRQNVPFLREWLVYHISIGVDKFFLYDNSGKKTSTPLQKLRTSGTSKYGFNLYQMIPYTDNEIQRQWKLIMQDFKQYIVYVKWKPKDKNGNILYNQPQSIRHYVQFYSGLTDFTIFIDIDEFLFSEKQLDLTKYLRNKYQQGYSKIELHQKKFQDRWCGFEHKKVTQIYQCVDVNTHYWAEKSIIHSKDIDPGQIVHYLHVAKGWTMTAPNNQFRFNHYNLNAKQYQWMSYTHYQTTTYTRCYDSSMKMHDEVIERGCNDQCHDKNFKLKYPQGAKKRKLCYSPGIMFQEKNKKNQ